MSGLAWMLEGHEARGEEGEKKDEERWRREGKRRGGRGRGRGEEGEGKGEERWRREGKRRGTGRGEAGEGGKEERQWQ